MKKIAYYFLLIVICLAFYLPGIASIPITDRDSAHFAQASRQMALTHDYWTIHFQNKSRHLKPPGIYWLNTLSIKLFGDVNSNQVWPYTLVSVLGGILAVLFTFGFARRMYGDGIALLAAGFLIASPLLIIESHLIVTDSTLLMTIVLMQGALWQLYVAERTAKPSHWCWALLFWVGMAAGIVIKGLTPLVAVLTILGICIMDRNIRWLRSLRFYWGLPVVILLTLAWLIPLCIASGSNFLWEMWSQDAWPKIVSGQQSHGMPPGYFMVIFTLLFWPGALFLWYLLAWSWQQRAEASVRFLLAWIIPSWIFFELIPSKLPEYVLPTFPAIAILTAHSVIAYQRLSLQGIWRWLSRIQGFFWVIAGLMMLDIVIMVTYHFEHKIFPSSIVVAAIIGITMLASLSALYTQRLKQAAYCNIIGMLLVFSMTLHFVVPQWHQFWVSQKVVNTINQLAPDEITSTHPLLTVGYSEPSLVFLMGGNKVMQTTQARALAKLQDHSATIILVDQSQVKQFELLAKQHTQNLHIIATVHGFNYSKGHWVTLSLFKSED